GSDGADAFGADTAVAILLRGAAGRKRAGLAASPAVHIGFTAVLGSVVAGCRVTGAGRATQRFAVTVGIAALVRLAGATSAAAVHATLHPISDAVVAGGRIATAINAGCVPTISVDVAALS